MTERVTTTLLYDVYDNQGNLIAPAGARIEMADYGLEGYVPAPNGKTVTVGPEYLSSHGIQVEPSPRTARK